MPAASLLYTLLQLNRLFEKSLPGQGVDSEVDKLDQYYDEQLIHLAHEAEEYATNYEMVALNLIKSTSKTMVWQFMAVKDNLRSYLGDLSEVSASARESIKGTLGLKPQAKK